MSSEVHTGRKSIPEEIEVQIDRMVFSGEGRGRYGRRLVFVWGGLPGETVMARVTKRRRNSLNAIVTRVVEPAPQRVEACESHYLCCSPWQVLDESCEVAWKGDAVRELFAAQHKIELPDFEVADGKKYGYRNKLEFGFTDTAEGVSLSFFQRGSFRNKLAIEGCQLGSPAINQAAARICETLRRDEVRSEQLKSLMLRSNHAGEVAAALFVKDAEFPPVPGIELDQVLTGFRVFYSNPESPASLASATLQDLGSVLLSERVLGCTLRFSERSFFQVNIPMFETALEEIRSHVLEGPFYDLYSGVGTIGLALEIPQPVFLESDPECLDLLKRNCAENGLEDPKIIAAPAEKYLEEIPANATVVLDPPRAGLHPKFLKRLLAAAPRRVIYLSCNPKTQAIDLEKLLQHYELIHFKAFNFFPRTPHLESLAVLDRA